MGTGLRRRPPRVAAATAPGPLPRINLVPGSLARTRRLRRRQVGMTAAVLGAAGLVLAGDLVAGDRAAAAQRRRDVATQRERQVAREVDRYREVRAADDAVDAARATLRAALGSEIRFSRLLDALSTNVPATVQITAASWQEEGAPATTGTSPGDGAPGAGTTGAGSTGDGATGTVTIRGVTTSFDQVATWLDAFGRLPGVADPVLTDAVTTGGLVRFTSAAVLTPAAQSQRYAGRDGGLR